mgnify:CR=1 FL=1
MKKVEITDDTGKIIKVDIEKFKKHLDEYHLNGSSVHEENGHYFTVDQKFRENLFKIKESK